MTENRIFVFGSGRSGTTMLAKLLDAAPEVLYRHEPDKLRPNEKIPFLPEPDDYGRLAPEAGAYLAQLFRERLPFVVGKRPLFTKSYRSPFQARTHTLLLSFLGLAEKARLPLPVPDLTNGDRKVEVLKSVTSVCRVPLLSSADPQVKFVHIVRHPGAVVASLLKGIEQGVMARNDFFDNVSQMSHAASLPVAADEVRDLDFAHRTAYVWMVQNDKTRHEMANSDNYLLVSYEDLCVNMVERLTEIYRFAGLEYGTQTVAFVDAMNGAGDSSAYFSVVRNPVASISSWESKVGHDAVQEIEQLIAQSAVGRFVLEKYRAAKQHLSD